MRGYAICTEPRSGSSYLCRLLESTGVLGHPREYFNVQALRRFGVPDYPEDPEGQLAAIPRLSATPNGVYGLKIFTTHFDAVAATRWAVRLPGLAFISLQRRDLLGQAISHVRAMQTQQWTSRIEARREPVYNAGLINNELVRLARCETRWRYYFARNGVQPLHLVYEDLEADPMAAVEAVCRLMGLEETPGIDPSEVGITVQRDSLNEDWRARYLADSRDLTVLH